MFTWKLIVWFLFVIVNSILDVIWRNHTERLNQYILKVDISCFETNVINTINSFQLIVSVHNQM